MLKFKLLNSQSPDDSQDIEIGPENMLNGECFIGRSSKCGIVLESPQVSRVHGSLGIEAGQYYFTDLASLAGSLLNQQTVKVNQKYYLKPEDTIQIGNFSLVIQTINPPQSATEAKASALQQGPLATISDSPLSPTKSPMAAPVQTAPPTPVSSPAPTKVAAPTIPAPTPELAGSPQDYMPVALVDPKQFPHWPKGELPVRCVQIIDETGDAKTFRFVANPPVLFTYQPGQFMTLNLNINGKPVKRSYSISSTPSRPHSLEITVKRVPPPRDVPDAPPGLVSNWLHDHMEVGQEITVKGPLGKFTCFANPSPKLLLISAGSGVTPMMSMSRWIADTAADIDVVFLHSARGPNDIIYQRELELMALRQPKFRVVYTATRVRPDQVWTGYMGRINADMLKMIAPDFRERTVYVCGPNPFMAGVKALLAGIEFPMENYYEESFGGAKKPKSSQKLAAAPAPPTIPSVTMPNVAAPAAPMPVAPAAPMSATPAPAAGAAADSGSTATVVFAKSGKTVSTDGATPILDIAEEEGIEIDSSCRSGVCGTCKQQKLEGDVKYDEDPDALDDEEQEAGFVLTCIACPVGRVVIDA